MQTVKMSLANAKGKLSRAEMKSIMAGSDGGGSHPCTKECTTDSDCGHDMSDCPKCKLPAGGHWKYCSS